jgi:hypothetical protein
VRRRERDRPEELRLALREVDGHLTYTAGSVWAWYLLPNQQWAFRSEAQRESLIVAAADAMAGLAGKRVHVRVTTRPYPVAAWARRLDLLTPTPADGWYEHLIGAQEHLRGQTMAQKEVYVGVRVASRSGGDLTLDRMLRRPARRERARLAAAADRLTETMSLPGLEGRPLRASEVEWLLRRSIGVGLPPPAQLSAVRDPHWDTDDLHTLTDPVTLSAQPFSRTVEVTGFVGDETVTRHVAVLTLGRVEEIEAPHPAHDPWLAHADRLPFPVEWSMRFDVLGGAEARRTIQRKLLVVRDMQRHFREHDLDEPLALDRQARNARLTEDEMTTGADVLATRVHGWFRVAISGRTEEECLERARQATAAYRARRMTLEHPRGQYGLLREFVPGEAVSSTAYRRRLPALYLAAGVPNASSSVGDRRGPYLGTTTGSSRQAVMFDTHYATEVRETSGLVPIVGGLGAGKSVLMGSVVYEAVRRGIPSVVFDPSGPLSRLTELPAIADRSQHLDLTSAEPGTLNPFAIVLPPRRDRCSSDEAYEEAKAVAAADRRLLATDVVRMLLPPSVDRMPSTSLVLQDAVHRTGGAPNASLWSVVQHLEAHDDPQGQVIARYLRDTAELPMARLFFPSGGRPLRQLDALLTVLTMPGLVLPPRNVDREHWSTSELLAVPLLHLAAWYATRAIYGRLMPERKLIALDETHFLGDWSMGRALFTRLGRDSRKWNTCVLAASQTPADLLGMDVGNLISAAFVGRLEDAEAAADGLRLLGVERRVGYERVLGTLSSGRGDVPYREFVVRDVDGHVDKVRVDLSHHPDLLAALDTTAKAPRRTRELDGLVGLDGLDGLDELDQDLTEPNSMGGPGDGTSWVA